LGAAPLSQQRGTRIPHLRARLRKLGEDVIETLEVIRRQWKVIQHVREKLETSKNRDFWAG
jgi:transposase